MNKGTTRSVILWDCGCLFGSKGLATLETTAQKEGNFSCPSCGLAGALSGVRIQLAPDSTEFKELEAQLPEKIRKKRETLKKNKLSKSEQREENESKEGQAERIKMAENVHGDGSHKRRAEEENADHPSKRSKIFNEIFKKSGDRGLADGFGTRY